jgi:hypothetical protein
VNDDELRDLLSEAVDDVEPRYALDEIRARTTTPRPRWPYAVGGAVLAVAASVTAFALLADGGTTPRATDPVSSPSSSPTPSDDPSAPDDLSSSAPATEVPSITVPVYYVGDTPDGPRLYAELRTVAASNPFDGAIAALEQAPLDPDYRNYWPAGAIESIHFNGIGEDGGHEVVLSDPSLRERPAGMDEATARMAVEQVIYTVQARTRAPVQFMYDHNPIDQVFGVPTSEPLANGPVLDTLALVSLTTPAEGMVVDNDEPLVVEGAGNSFEGNIVTRFEDPSGTQILAPQPVIAGWMEERLFPFRLTLDLSEVPPGYYVVTSHTDDPSGQGLFHEDTRSVKVVD